jgi:putative acetyltransferase
MKLVILKYHPEFKAALLEVWERSVLASHTFLREADFQEIKNDLTASDFGLSATYCATINQSVVGYISVHEHKIESLFIDPTYIGVGVGTALVKFAFTKHNVHLVDVHEQNEKAKAFYQNIGFRCYERTELDDFGFDYPLLKMKLRTKKVKPSLVSRFLSFLKKL